MSFAGVARRSHQCNNPFVLSLPTSQGARLVALDLLDAVDTARARLSDPHDHEALHDFRVALRRLRSWLRAFDDALGLAFGAQVKRRLNALAGATGESRDLQVHVQWLESLRDQLDSRERTGVDRLLGELHKRKSSADARLARVLDRRYASLRDRVKDQCSTFTAHVRHDTKPETWLGTVASELIEKRLAKMCRALDGVHSIRSQRPAHEARIAEKRLRYLLEPLRGDVPSLALLVERLAVLQDVLGDMHDADVFGSDVRREIKRLSAKGHHEDAFPGLRAIDRRLAERKRAAYQDLETNWLGANVQALAADIRIAAAALRANAAPDIEIERKYLLRGMPRLPKTARPSEIEQGYLPGRRLLERIRRVRTPDGERYYRTMKSGSGVRRQEVEEETSREVFEALWPLTQGRRVSKVRYSVPAHHLTWEVDAFSDRELVLAEVELQSEEETADLPRWLAPVMDREVTSDPAFTNANLAK